MEIFPAISPDKILLMITIVSVSAKASMTYEIDEPIKLIIKTFFRPIESLSLPQNGEAMN